jgi:hypothetical protein
MESRAARGEVSRARPVTMADRGGRAGAQGVPGRDRGCTRPAIRDREGGAAAERLREIQAREASITVAT